MEKSEKKGRKKRIEYNHLGMLGIALVVLILLVGLMLKSQDLKGTLAVYNARAASLEQDIESEKARTEEIEQLREYMLTDEYAEQVARERLGLIKENEIVFQEEN